MKKTQTVGSVSFKIFNSIFLIALSLLCIYPIIYVLFASVSNSAKLMSYGGLLLKPLDFTLSAYKKVFANELILSGYKNTIINLLLGVSISMILTILGAYFMSRKKLLFKNTIVVLIIITMYFSGGLIPLYLTVKALKIDNTLWAVILPQVVNTYNMIILKTGFEAVPQSLEESAVIDGANQFWILWKVLVPLVKASLAVVCLYYAVANWNAWFNASIYLSDREKYPLQLVLREILILNDTVSMTADSGAVDIEGISKTVQYATIIVATLPILVVYPYAQRYFEKGTMIGAIKG